jgi:predicted AAA+ superfamily ATPase
VPRAARRFPRHLASRLREALSDTPAVLIHGPRQCGKTTLAQAVGEPRGYRYLSFDDETLTNAARADPVGFVDGLASRSILDEVQRVPEIFPALKAAIDRRRSPGRFILTGSANVLFVPRLADSLAGRMGILRLHPLSQGEIEGRRPRFIDRLFDAAFETDMGERLGSALAERIVAGGYPAALARRVPARRRAWYRDYIDTQIQRDVRDLTRLRSLDVLPKLLALTAAATARLVNVQELAAPFELTRQTIHEYVTLERSSYSSDCRPGTPIG